MPAVLRVIRVPAIPNSSPEQRSRVGDVIPLNTLPFVLGRRARCQLVLYDSGITREHAQIELVEDRYFIVDRESVNGTFVNDLRCVPCQRMPLTHHDRIRLGQLYEFSFLDLADSSRIEEVVTPSAETLLEAQSAERLRGLLEIITSLSRTLDLDPMLPGLAEKLFGLFVQADRCFLIQADEPPRLAGARGERPRLHPRLVKTRSGKGEGTAHFSSSIVYQCLTLGQAQLHQDATEAAVFKEADSVEFLGIRSVMVAPLLQQDGRPFAVLQLDTLDPNKKFRKDDLALLTGVANQTAVALENVRLHREAICQAEFQARLEYDLEMAREVQMSFLPRAMPEVPSYEFFAYYQPAHAVGGDYYGFIPRQDGQLLVVVGDVAGKGMPAALLVAKLSTEINTCAPLDLDLAGMVAHLNELLYPFTNPKHRFITLAALLLDPIGHRHGLVSAGHPSPMIYQPGTGTCLPILDYADSGHCLGNLDRSAYVAHPVTLEPGEILIVFSDGVTESFNSSIQPFRVAGMQAALAEHRPTTSRTVVETILRAVEQHTGGIPPHDDLTLLAVQRTA